MILSTLPPDIAHFGVAGLMGAMWLWERRTSQKREQQLDEAHTRIVGDRVQLEQLISLVRDNTESVQRLASAQEQLAHQLRDQLAR